VVISPSSPGPAAAVERELFLKKPLIVSGDQLLTDSNNITSSECDDPFSATVTIQKEESMLMVASDAYVYRPSTTLSEGNYIAVLVYDGRFCKWRATISFLSSLGAPVYLSFLWDPTIPVLGGYLQQRFTATSDELATALVGLSQGTTPSTPFTSYSCYLRNFYGTTWRGQWSYSVASNAPEYFPVQLVFPSYNEWTSTPGVGIIGCVKIQTFSSFSGRWEGSDKYACVITGSPKTGFRFWMTPNKVTTADPPGSVAAVNDIFWNTTCMQLQNAVNFITDAVPGATTTVNSVFSVRLFCRGF
jgi:hypothetical protein